MSMQEVIVVFEPLWQDMKRDDPPVTLPDLKDTFITNTIQNIFENDKPHKAGLSWPFWLDSYYLSTEQTACISIYF